jgi:hypothetical protein
MRYPHRPAVPRAWFQSKFVTGSPTFALSRAKIVQMLLPGRRLLGTPVRKTGLAGWGFVRCVPNAGSLRERYLHGDLMRAKPRLSLHPQMADRDRGFCRWPPAWGFLHRCGMLPCASHFGQGHFGQAIWCKPFGASHLVQAISCMPLQCTTTSRMAVLRRDNEKLYSRM